MARLIRIAHARETYSGVLLMMLWGAAAAVADDAPRLAEAVMEVTLSNTEPGEMVVVLRGPDGELYLEESDFKRLRLHLPPTQAYLHEGRRFFEPRAIKGCVVRIDEAAQRVVIGPPPASLATTHLSAAPRRSPDLPPASPAAFPTSPPSPPQL